MIKDSDVPSFASLERLDDVPGDSGGEPALRSHVPELRNLLQSGTTMLTIDALTGSGKTRVIPLAAQEVIGGKLLVVAKSTLDVVKLQAELACPAHYCMGGHREGGVHISKAKIVIATAGLTARWYASLGEDFAWRYKGVFFDELGEMELDPEYALVFDVALRVRQKRWFVVLGAGSALSTASKNDSRTLGLHGSLAISDHTLCSRML